MRNDRSGEEYSETPPVRRCGHCGEPLISQRRRAKYCSREHKELAREGRKRASDRLTTLRKNHPFADATLSELHEHASAPQHWRDDPRNFSDYGDVPGDLELAAEIDAEDEAGIYHAIEPERELTDKRINVMLQADTDSRTPRETWKRWRAHGRRHGTEDPAQTADRIARHRAAEAACMARIDASTAGRVQDRFDTRTASNVASKAGESRALNARHADQPPLASRGFDFQGESVNGGPYRRGRASGQRPGHADYAWRMEDGFTY